MSDEQNMKHDLYKHRIRYGGSKPPPYRKRTPGDGCPYRAWQSVSQTPPRRCHPDRTSVSGGIFAPNICIAATEMRRSFDFGFACAQDDAVLGVPQAECINAFPTFPPRGPIEAHRPINGGGEPPPYIVHSALLVRGRMWASAPTNVPLEVSHVFILP